MTAGHRSFGGGHQDLPAGGQQRLPAGGQAATESGRQDRNPRRAAVLLAVDRGPVFGISVLGSRLPRYESPWVCPRSFRH
jgi:hypothetical protein